MMNDNDLRDIFMAIQMVPGLALSIRRLRMMRANERRKSAGELTESSKPPAYVQTAQIVSPG